MYTNDVFSCSPCLWLHWYGYNRKVVLLLALTCLLSHDKPRRSGWKGAGIKPGKLVPGIKKKKIRGREYPKWYNNHRIIQIRGMEPVAQSPLETRALESQGVCVLPLVSPVPPHLPLGPAPCHMLASEAFCFYAFQWCYHFPHPICILYTCVGECYWKCHLFQSCETTNGNSLYQQL